MTKNNIMNINFDDGFKEISINGDKSRTIRWNPSDINFIDRWFALIGWIENDLEKLLIDAGVTDGLSEDDYKAGNVMKVGNLINDRINELFNSNVMEIAFLGSNPISPTPNGPLFANFIAAIAPILEASFKEAEVNVNKYTKKAIDHKKQMKGK